MHRPLFPAVVLLLAIAAAARADIPLPDNLKYVDPRVAFEGVEKHPDYVFHLRFLTFVGGPSGVPHRLVEVRNADAFNLNAQRRLFDMKLLAMDRKEFEKRSQGNKSLDWLTDETPGVIAAEVDSPSTTAPKKLAEAPVTRYRVELKGGKLTVETVADKQSGIIGRFDSLPTWIAGFALSAAIASGGFLLIRRSSGNSTAAAAQTA
jgi:hypothetical protein